MLTNKNFKCDRYCGKCCMNLTIMVDNSDVNKIKKLGYNINDFIEMDLIDENKFILRKKDNGHCIFLKKNKRIYSCNIHKNRPKICQKYPFFSKKPIKSCYPEDMFPNAMFSFKAGRNNQ